MDLAQWLPEAGSVGAVILVVMFFLRHIKEGSSQLALLAKTCHEHQQRAQASFETSLDRIVASSERNTDRVIAELRQMQEAQKGLINRINQKDETT